MPPKRVLHIRTVTPPPHSPPPALQLRQTMIIYESFAGRHAYALVVAQTIKTFPVESNDVLDLSPITIDHRHTNLSKIIGF